MHSSVAFVLFVISLTGAGLIGLPLALTLVLGANVGAGLVALGLAARRSRWPARRVIYGNLAFRADRRARGLPRARAGHRRRSARLGGDPGRLAAHFHTLFNLGARRRLPAADRARRAAARAALPRPRAGREAPRLDHLDPALLDRPALALNAATRAMLALADKVELMLRETILTFEEPDGRRIQEVAALEEEVDADQEAIKLYLAQLMQRELTPEESAQVLEAVLFTTNLEHIGDIIDKGLLRLAAKKQKQGLQLLRRRLARHPRLPRADRRADAPGARGLRHPRRRRRARPRGREGPAARRGVPRQRAPLRAACATGCPRRSRPARCTSTCCAT